MTVKRPQCTSTKEKAKSPALENEKDSACDITTSTSVNKVVECLFKQYQSSVSTTSSGDIKPTQLAVKDALAVFIACLILQSSFIPDFESANRLLQSWKLTDNNNQIFTWDDSTTDDKILPKVFNRYSVNLLLAFLDGQTACRIGDVHRSESIFYFLYKKYFTSKNVMTEVPKFSTEFGNALPICLTSFFSLSPSYRHFLPPKSLVDSVRNEPLCLYNICLRLTQHAFDLPPCEIKLREKSFESAKNLLIIAMIDLSSENLVPDNCVQFVTKNKTSPVIDNSLLLAALLMAIINAGLNEFQKDSSEIFNELILLHDWITSQPLKTLQTGIGVLPSVIASARLAILSFLIRKILNSKQTMSKKSAETVWTLSRTPTSPSFLFLSSVLEYPIPPHLVRYLPPSLRNKLELFTNSKALIPAQISLLRKARLIVKPPKGRLSFGPIPRLPVGENVSQNNCHVQFLKRQWNKVSAQVENCPDRLFRAQIKFQMEIMKIETKICPVENEKDKKNKNNNSISSFSETVQRIISKPKKEIIPPKIRNSILKQMEFLLDAHLKSSAERKSTLQNSETVILMFGAALIIREFSISVPELLQVHRCLSEIVKKTDMSIFCSELNSSINQFIESLSHQLIFMSEERNQKNNNFVFDSCLRGNVCEDLMTIEDDIPASVLLLDAEELEKNIDWHAIAVRHSHSCTSKINPFLKSAQRRRKGHITASRTPKNWNPDKMPKIDPERWLPLSERTTYQSRTRAQKTTRMDGTAGSQGQTQNAFANNPKPNYTKPDAKRRKKK